MQYLVIPPKPLTRWQKFLAWIKARLNKIHCAILGHDWTSAVERGIPPTEEQLQNGFKGFLDYAKLECKRCGEQCKLND